ncbi:MAG: Asp-tRNA(Asn)/Glu-tRNA(Gln) amidotransferase subunit GatB [bacterium]|nr:Asp-tRNA(Asn)/Glu-tRNA(Gln) amidotransferase subunit GatB [bacterium]
MKDYILTVGLEIHVELATKTKMFCNSKNDSSEKRPNVNICPICVGYPGTLPVINQEAVRSVLRLGVSVGGEIADYTEFDRKNYFYPDIPKGYQISQYKHPLVSGGELAGVKLTRIHLEEDTARSIHVSSSPQNDADSTQNNAESIQRSSASSLRESATLVDFNRAGIPLMELVTEPVIKTVAEAVNFACELQLLLKYLNVSGTNMEKGEMRIEANVSVRNAQASMTNDQLGTKVEIKNLNSFKVVEKAIIFEMERQIEILEKGEKVVQETRGWDENKEVTFLQRLKESAHDYCYFPDPDLPKLFIKAVPDFAPEALRRAMPELPWQKRERYKRDFGLKEGDIEIYVRDQKRGRLLEETAEILGDTKLIGLASNYITNDLKTIIPSDGLVEVIRMVSLGAISSRGAKDILRILEIDGGEPRLIADKNNLIQNSDIEELKTIAKKIIEDNPKIVTEYKKGKTAPLQFLIGQAVKTTKGNGNPLILKGIFEELLK